ncbi:MAG: hypothetical protein NZ108_04645 [Bacteroidia bacterium]|nr:hypothetical protein [Bacteroidia bacterium]
MRSLFLTLLAATSIMLSCSKEDKVEVPETVFMLLTNNNVRVWKPLTDKVISTDTTVPILNCITDDKYYFYSNGKLSLVQGDVKCDPMEPYRVNGTWKYEPKRRWLMTQMILDTGIVAYDTVEILKLAGDTLKVRTSTFRSYDTLRIYLAQ